MNDISPVEKEQSNRRETVEKLLPIARKRLETAIQKEATRKSSKPSPSITLRGQKPKHPPKEFRRRGSSGTKDLQCGHCQVSVSFENEASLRRHVANKHRRQARKSCFAALPAAGGPRTFNGKVAHRCRSDAERILGGSSDEALLEFRSYIAKSDHYGAVWKSTFQFNE